MKIPFFIIFVARWDASKSTRVSQETQVRLAPTSVLQLAVLEKYPYSLHRWGLEFLGGRDVGKGGVGVP